MWHGLTAALYGNRMVIYRKSRPGGSRHKDWAAAGGDDVVVVSPMTGRRGAMAGHLGPSPPAASPPQLASVNQPPEDHRRPSLYLWPVKTVLRDRDVRVKRKENDGPVRAKPPYTL